MKLKREDGNLKIARAELHAETHSTERAQRRGVLTECTEVGTEVTEKSG